MDTVGTSLAKRQNRELTNDEMLTHICLDKTMGEVVQYVETCKGPRVYMFYKWVRDAVLDFDVDKIEKIVQRIDGGVPEADAMAGVANYFGNALNDVLDYESIDDIRALLPEDPPIIALAKALYLIAVRDNGTNAQKRKDSAKAMDILMARTGGKKVKPVREQIEAKYEDPDWMKGELPDAEG